MTCIIALTSATSVPLLKGAYMSACLAVIVNLGSILIIVAPFSLARRTRRPINGWSSKVFDPRMKMVLASSKSLIEFVIAPLPSDFARPATVVPWHSLAQWSMFAVSSATRANFCMT